MLLKFLPKDIDLSAMVNMTIITLQSTLLRVQEIQDMEKRTMTENEMIALHSLLDVLNVAADDATKFYDKVRN